MYIKRQFNEEFNSSCPEIQLFTSVKNKCLVAKSEHHSYIILDLTYNCDF